MQTKKIFLLFLIIVCGYTATGQIITVKQDGTGNYTTIQQAVDASIDGDTVLVWPGTYIENVSCDEKNITVGSLTLTSGNNSYIQQTIIDGNYTGSCIKIYNCQTNIIINGFTLEYGNGSWSGYIDGGGIFIKNSFAKIYNCIVQNNKVTGYGGGIYLHTSDAFLSNVTIKNNHAYDRGGGILLLNSYIEFDSINKCNIYLNYASVGTDIYKMGDGSPPMHIIVDTFTVLSPDYYYTYSQGDIGYPNNDITYEINAGKIQAVTQNLYVNTNGDNQNSGLTPDESLKDISFALLKMASDSIQPDTIHVSNGIYSLSSGEKFPLSLKKNVSIQGENRDSTILDAENEIFILNGIVFADNYKISKLTLRNGNGDTISPYNFGAFIIFENHNALFENLLVTENTGRLSSSGSVRQSNNITIKAVDYKNNIGGSTLRVGNNSITQNFSDTIILINCRFIENFPDYSISDGAFGGGLAIIGQTNYSDSITCYLYNCLFTQNHTQNYIWAFSNSLGLYNGQAYVINCTMGGNTSDNSQGANIGVTYNSNLYIYNSILYGNYPAEIYMYTNNSGDCDLNIYNSLIECGEEGIRILSPYNNVYYDYTNIDTDPLWDTAGFYPYMLTAGSPCINTGTLDLPEGVVLPETDILGNPRIWDGFVDMGAYEYGPWVGLDYYNQKAKSKKQKLLKAAPNPFNYGTYISYITKESGHIKIDVYDMNGRKVNTLMDVKQLPGSGEFYWDGTDDYGRKLPAGNYLLKLIINNNSVDNVKLVKIK
jgi:hypothetical protein